MKNITTAILLGFVLLMSSGCCSNRSLLKASMADQVLDNAVRNKFKNAVSLEERFLIAASMTDWRMTNPMGWHMFSVLPWDNESLELHVPLIGYTMRPMFGGPCSGMPTVDGMLKIKFDQAGQILDTQRIEQEFHLYDFSKAFAIVEDFRSNDPWAESSYQYNFCPVFATEFEGDFEIKRRIDVRESSDRYIFINYSEYSNDPYSLAGRVNITTSPQVEFEVVSEQYSNARTHFLSGAYIVQNSDFRARSGDKQNETDPPFDFVPKFVTNYQSFIILAPHDGVEIQVDIAVDEATP
jgi:hypothetical protein